MKPLFTTLIATAMATGAMIASTNAATFSMTTSGFPQTELAAAPVPEMISKNTLLTGSL